MTLCIYHAGHHSLRPGPLVQPPSAGLSLSHLMKLNVPLRVHQSDFKWFGCPLVPTEPKNWDRWRCNDIEQTLETSSLHLQPPPQFLPKTPVRSDWPCHQQPAASEQRQNNPGSAQDLQQWKENTNLSRLPALSSKFVGYQMNTSAKVRSPTRMLTPISRTSKLWKLG